MNQSDQPYKGQKFKSFEELKEYLDKYGERNYIKFWIRSSHTRNSLKSNSKLSRTMNPNFKYVSVKFACIFGGEKIRCRGSGKRKSYTYRNLGCPFMINAVVGEDGNHVKLDTVILEHNHALCKPLYDSLKKAKRKNESLKTAEKEFKPAGELSVKTEILEEKDENCLKDIEDKYGKIVKVLVVKTEDDKEKEECDESPIENVEFLNSLDLNQEVCRLCLSSSGNLSPIFNPNLPLESTVLSFKIMGCASIEISLNDGLPNNICKTCEENLDIAYNFRIRCEKSDSILRETYSRLRTIPTSIEFRYEDDSSTEENSSSSGLVVYPEEEKEETKTEESPEEPVYIQFANTCPLCGSDFDAYETMLEHLGSHTDGDSFLLSCNVCTLVVSTVTELQSHMASHLNEAGATETWTCLACEQGFVTEEDLRSHEKVHEDPEERTMKFTPVVKYLCNVCGKIFRTKDRFQAHKNMHEGLRPHVCAQCGRGFADRKNLYHHYDVVHLRRVRYECPTCQRKFYTRTKMRSHMTMHSGDKPFTCDICNKTFRLKMNMIKHKKTHSSDRPYQCDKCDAAFLEKNLLRRHSYKHGGVRPYRCSVCDRGFSVRFALKKHLRNSKCSSMMVAEPETVNWGEIVDPVRSLNDNKCLVVYKNEVVQEETLQEGGETIALNILQEYKDESTN